MKATFKEKKYNDIINLSCRYAYRIDIKKTNKFVFVQGDAHEVMKFIGKCAEYAIYDLVKVE